MNANLESYANKVLAAPMENLSGGMMSAAEPVMTVVLLAAAAVTGGAAVVGAYALGKAVG